LTGRRERGGPPKGRSDFPGGPSVGAVPAHRAICRGRALGGFFRGGNHWSGKGGLKGGLLTGSMRGPPVFHARLPFRPPGAVGVSFQPTAQRIPGRFSRKRIETGRSLPVSPFGFKSLRAPDRTPGWLCRGGPQTPLGGGFFSTMGAGAKSVGGLLGRLLLCGGGGSGNRLMIPRFSPRRTFLPGGQRLGAHPAGPPCWASGFFWRGLDSTGFLQRPSGRAGSTRGPPPRGGRGTYLQRRFLGG